jgi:chromosome segregation ATPase
MVAIFYNETKNLQINFFSIKDLLLFLQYAAKNSFSKGYLAPIILFPVLIYILIPATYLTRKSFTKALTDKESELKEKIENIEAQKNDIEKEKKDLPEKIKKGIEEELKEKFDVLEIKRKSIYKEKAKNENIKNNIVFERSQLKEDIQRKKVAWTEEIQNLKRKNEYQKKQIGELRGRIKQVATFLEDDPPQVNKAIKYLKRMAARKNPETGIRP